MNRRGFIKSILASAVAPYVVTTAGVLMPVRKIVVPEFSEAALEEILVDMMKQPYGLSIPITSQFATILRPEIERLFKDSF